MADYINISKLIVFLYTQIIWDQIAIYIHTQMHMQTHTHIHIYIPHTWKGRGRRRRKNFLQEDSAHFQINLSVHNHLNMCVIYSKDHLLNKHTHIICLQQQQKDFFKYLGINLTKNQRTLPDENVMSLLRSIKDDLNKTT